MPRRLSRVDNHRYVMFPRDPADFADRLHRAGHVAGVSDGDQLRIGPDRSGNFLGINQTRLWIDFDARHIKPAVFFKGAKRAKDRVVIDMRANGMAALARIDKPFNGKIQRFSAIEREDEMIGVLAIEKFD